jgi:hypothetical protein
MLDRRRFISGTAAACGLAALASPGQASRYAPEPLLRPGQFQWSPERAASGAIFVIASPAHDLLHVYRGGVEIGAAACAFGQPGAPAPRGAFSVTGLERQDATGSDGLPRLAWVGTAVEAAGVGARGSLIRLPLDFAVALHKASGAGMAFLIASHRTTLQTVRHPGLLLASHGETDAERVRAAVQAGAGDGAPASVLVSVSDRKAYLIRNGAVVETHTVAIRNPLQPFGHFVNVLDGVTGGSLVWHAIGVASSPREPHLDHADAGAALRRIELANVAAALPLALALRPGSMIVVVDQASTPPRRPGDRIVIAANEGGDPLETGTLSGGGPAETQPPAPAAKAAPKSAAKAGKQPGAAQTAPPDLADSLFRRGY